MIDPPALELRGVTKKFGAVTALDEASIAIRKGTIHALLGENGAGKSTLMNIAFGAVRADAGSILVDGVEMRAFSPRAAIRAGLGMVHQHFTNVPAMTVAENVALGGSGRFDRSEWSERVREIGRSTGLALDPDARVGDLPVSAQQRLEVVKAFARNARILILDEPTAVLTGDEAASLLSHLRAFVSGGGTVVLITHKLREAAAFADAATVLRRGRTVLTAETLSLSEGELAAAMLGESEGDGEATAPSAGATAAASVSAAAAAETAEAAEISLRCESVSVADERGTIRVRGATLEVRRGEILGIAAAEGAGQHELLRALAGRAPLRSGSVEGPSRVGFIPEDRQLEGLILDFPLYENLALRGAGERRGLIDWDGVRGRADELLRTHDVRAESAREQASNLSGGNQQRFILARELSDSPELVIAENPTRGLDIRAAASVHERLRAAKRGGAAIVLYSSDLDEVVALSDRVLVMYAGEVREAGTDRAAIGRAMVGT